MGVLVEVFRSLSLTETICAKSYLDAHIVFTLIQNEHHITMSSGVLSLALGGYRIVTLSEEAAEAARLLATADVGEIAINDDFDEDSVSLSLW